MKGERGLTRSIKLSSLTDIEHRSLQRQQDPLAISSVERFQGPGSVVLEKKGLLSFERKPGVAVVVRGRRRVPRREASWNGREEERVDEVERREREKKGDHGRGEESGRHRERVSVDGDGLEEERRKQSRMTFGELELSFLLLLDPLTTSSSESVNPEEPNLRHQQQSLSIRPTTFHQSQTGDEIVEEDGVSGFPLSLPFPSLLPFASLPFDAPSLQGTAAMRFNFYLQHSSFLKLFQHRR